MKFCIGFVAPFIYPKDGEASYSPGLRYDVDIYESVLKEKYDTLHINTRDYATETLQTDIEKCDVIIAFEHFGSIEIVNAIKAVKQIKRMIVALVPNLEVMGSRPKSPWSPTLNNLQLVDVVIYKLPNLQELTEKWVARYFPGRDAPITPVDADENKADHVKLVKLVKNVQLICVSHCSPRPKIPLDLAISPESRRNIIHLAGSSHLKNTLQSCIAGIELVKKHRPALSKLIVKITAWPGDKYALNMFTGDFAEIQRVCRENVDCVELIMGGYMSDEEKARLYMSARVALCCSNAEGFGHYISDAAFYGCLVVTTDGVPMRDVLSVKGTYTLAKPSSIGHINYGILYLVPAENICKAAERLKFSKYNKARIKKCATNYDNLATESQKSLNWFSIYIETALNQMDSQDKYADFGVADSDNVGNDTGESNDTGAAAEETKNETKTGADEATVKYPPNFENKSDYAYVHLVMKGDKYTPGAFMSAYSIVRTNTKCDLICIVTNDVSEAARRAMSIIFTAVVEVPYINHTSRQLKTEKQQQLYDQWVDSAFTKWTCLLLTKYKKVMFIDADTVILRNMDHLFEMSAPAGTFSNPWAYPFAKGKRGINNPYLNVRHGDKITSYMLESGLNNNAYVAVGTTILLETGERDYHNYIRSIKSKVPFGFSGCHSMMDEQSIANFYLEQNREWTHIHQVYNYIPWHLGWLTNDPHTGSHMSTHIGGSASASGSAAVQSAKAKSSRFARAKKHVSRHDADEDSASPIGAVGGDETPGTRDKTPANVNADFTKPFIFHFFGNKPWDIEREKWPDLECWWNLVSILMRDERYTSADRNILNGYINQEQLELQIAPKCFWCKMHNKNDVNHAIYTDNSETGTSADIISCPLL